MTTCTESILQSPEFLAALTHPDPIVSQLLLVPFWVEIAQAQQVDIANQMIQFAEFNLNLSLAQVGQFGAIDLPEIPCACALVGVSSGYDATLYGAAGA